MSITQTHPDSEYSWIITTTPRDPPGGQVDAAAFKRRLGRIAYDVTEQDYGRSSTKRHYLFDLMDLPPEAEARARRDDDYHPGFKRIYDKWGHSAVTLERRDGGESPSYHVQQYKVRLGPAPDADRESIVQSIHDAAPPTEETRVWFGELGDGSHVIVHVGNHGGSRAHLSGFLDFLAELANTPLDGE